MIRYLLDTDTCIYPSSDIRRFSAEWTGFTREMPECPSCLMRNCVTEPGRAGRKSRIWKQRADWLGVITVQSLDDRAADHSGQKFAPNWRKAGKPIGAYDLLIAAHALALGVVLVTNNVGEFSRVAGLKLENWAQA